MTSFKPTPEQQAVIQHFCNSSESLIVEALAGAAKTTTIELAIAQRNPKQGEVLAIAFNKKIATALSERLPPNVRCSTMNALGHNAWGKYVGKRLRVESSKIYYLTSEVMEQHKEIPEDEYKEVSAAVRDLVAAAKTSGLVPNGCHAFGLAKGLL